MTEYAVKPGGTPKWTRDAALNDSDKSFTVPTGKRWDVKMVRGTLVTSATVGNRVLQIQITDGTNNLITMCKTASIAASSAGIVGVWENAPSSTSTTDIMTETGTSPSVSKVAPMPPLLLAAGSVIRVYDFAAIDAAADDLTVVFEYIEYDA